MPLWRGANSGADGAPEPPADWHAQAWASVEYGLWYARSADFPELPWMETLRRLRVIGDAIFMIGTAALAYFMLGLWRGWNYESEPASAIASEKLPKSIAATANHGA